MGHSHRSPGRMSHIGCTGSSGLAVHEWLYAHKQQRNMMACSSCVIPGHTDLAVLCPTCGTRGKRVGADTINALVGDDRRIPAGYPNGHYCPNAECATLYHFDGAIEPISKHEVKVTVGFKESQAPQMVCYCFGHTKSDIQDDFRSHGVSRIESSIRTAVVAGHCNCEIKNPQGRCCLGDVRVAYRVLGTPVW